MARMREITKIENMDDVQHLINRMLYRQEDIFTWEEIHKKIIEELIRFDAENITKTFKFVYMLNDTLDALVQSGDVIQISNAMYKYNHEKERKILYCFSY